MSVTATLSHTCSSDGTFGPVVADCRNGFDFTLRFEHIFFSILPSAVFIAASAYRIVCLFGSPPVVNGRRLQWTKTGAITIYAALWLALVVLATKSSLHSYDTAVGAAALTFLASLVSIALSWIEHARSIRPSVLFSFYLFFTLLLDAAQSRTALMISQDWAYSRVLTAATCAKGLILVIESYPKTRWAIDPQSSPEPSIGIFNIISYAWLNSLIVRGSRKLLGLGDLFALDPSMASKGLDSKFWALWESSSAHKGSVRLFVSLGGTMLWQMLAPILPRLAKLGFDFCQPFLIEAIGHHLSKPETEASNREGKALIGATVLIYLGTAASQGLYRYYNQRANAILRGILVASIYRKTTTLDLVSDESKSAVTLMSTDVERIQHGAQGIHDIWANTIEFALATWLLYVQLGIAFLVPIGVVLVCFVVTLVIGRAAPQYQEAWVGATEQRIGATATLIENIKSIKIMGLASRLGELIQKMRDAEIEAGSSFRMTVVYAVTCSFVPMTLSPVLTFAATSNDVDTTKAYASLSFLRLMTIPLASLFQLIPALIAATACFGRVATYLDTQSRSEYRSLVSSNSTQTESPNEEKGPEAFIIKNGSFGWKESKYVLQDLTLTIPESKLTMIVGPVASGKTTLCKVLLGEVPFTQGEVSFRPKLTGIGFCDQSPFIPNAAVRNVIIGHGTYDETWYNSVIKAAALGPDIASFEGGDQSMTGPNGSNLSGGQRQRLAIARALYPRPSILIFDDVFSGLDQVTEDTIVQGTLGPDGLLRNFGSTVVLCTHSTKHLPLADHVIALGREGKIVEEGTYAQFKEDQGDSYDRYIESISATVEGQVAVEKHPTQPAEDVDPSDAIEPPPDDFGIDDRTRQIGDLSVYKRYLGTLGPLLLPLFFIFSLVYAFCDQFGTVWLKFWSDYNTEHPGDKSRQGFYLGLYGFIQVFGLICLAASIAITCIDLIKRSGRLLHLNAIRTLVAAPLSVFNKTPSGVLLNRFAQDLNIVDTEIEEHLSDFVISAEISIGMAAVIATASPYVAISYPVIGIYLYFLQKFYLKTSRQLRYLDLETKSPLFTNFLEMISGLTTIRAFDWTESFISELHGVLDVSQQPAYFLPILQNWLTTQLSVMVAVLAIFVVALATQLRADVGLTGASLVSLMSFGVILSNMVDTWTKLELGLGAVSRLESFSSTVTNEHDDDETNDVPPEWPQFGAIELKNVSASYDGTKTDSQGTPSEKENLALRNINLIIKPGEKVAIVGRTGSGKSSMILLLLRLLDPLPQDGQSITIDGISLRTVDRDVLRSSIISIPQDTFSLPGANTYRSNLDPFGTASVADCEAALKDVELWSTIEEQGGLDQPMKAESLSKGQQQLFGIARAILRKWARSKLAAPDHVGGEKDIVTAGGILLLDEVTSSVDSETDSLIQRIIRREFSTYTVIVVTHREDTVQDFDRMIVMENGVIKENRIMK